MIIYLGCHMNYQMTKHYAKGEEKLIAEFNELNEARLFLTKKSTLDDEARKKVIYRLYKNYEILHESNKMNISVAYAKYAEGNGDFNNAAPFIFQVIIKSMDSLERNIIAQFYDKNDADLLVACIFEANYTVHDNDVFLIFKGKILMNTLNKTIIANQKKESGGVSGSEKESTCKLSPLSTRPTPSGGPPDYWVNHENDDENIK